MKLQQNETLESKIKEKIEYFKGQLVEKKMTGQSDYNYRKYKIQIRMAISTLEWVLKESEK